MVEAPDLSPSADTSLMLLYSLGLTALILKFKKYGKNRALKGKKQMVVLNYLMGAVLLLVLEGALYMEKNIYVLWAAMLIYVFILLEQFNFLVKKEVSRIL